MAYNNFYSGYNSPYYQQVNPYQINQAQPIQQNQVNSGFINVRSAEEAFYYPVALGNSVTFKDETAPFIYVKTRGFSQFEEPIFEQFQKVDNSQKAAEPAQTESPEYALKADITALQNEIDLLKKKVSEFKLVTNESEE